MGRTSELGGWNRTMTVAKTNDEEDVPKFTELRIWFTAVGFLTRLPCPTWCDHHAVAIMVGAAWYPTIGAIVGTWSAACHGAASALWSAGNVAAAVASAASVWMTGCFHEDGFGDTLDGIGGGWTKREILTIMQDSRVGSYAAVGFALFFVSKIALLTELGESQWSWGKSTGAGPALVVAHALARTAPPALLVCLPYVDETQGKDKGEFYRWLGRCRDILNLRRVFFAIATSLCVSAGLLGVARTVICAASVAMVVIGAGIHGQHMLGGIMGDYMGATTCVAEIAVYAILAADVEGVYAAFSDDPWKASVPFLFLAGIVAMLVTYCSFFLPLLNRSKCW